MSFNELKKVIENTKNIINEGMKELHHQSEQLETINSNKIEEYTIKSNKFLNRISSITYNIYHKFFHTPNNVVNPTIDSNIDSNIDSTTDSTIDSIENPIIDNISIKDEQYDYIQNSIKIIKQMSYELGEELDKQNEELDNINDSVSKNINDIKKLDKKIDKLL